MNTVLTNRLFTAANLLVTALVVYLAVDAFYMVAAGRLESPAAPAPSSASSLPGAARDMPPYSYYQAVVDRDLFRTAKTGEPAGEMDIENLEDTSLKVSLLGTVTGGPDWRYAFIEDSVTRRQGLYQEGDYVSGAVIRKILDTKVVLRVGGEDQVLRMEDRQRTAASAPAPRPSGPA
ncbi:MAG: hypothetical protein JRI97_10455, partial [Deltaproteobacteria bacterium]|nr:hypothetical protein [Deltaproteobacteria bacterium]